MPWDETEFVAVWLDPEEVGVRKSAAVKTVPLEEGGAKASPPPPPFMLPSMPPRMTPLPTPRGFLELPSSPIPTTLASEFSRERNEFALKNPGRSRIGARLPPANWHCCIYIYDTR